jgi:pantoate--beta-alanine ligase
MSVFAEDGQRTALVPTMGALHDGHLSLVRIAERVADKVIVSIFVNPTQFAPGEDFDAYPRDVTADLEKLSQAGVDLVYLPETGAIYAPDHSTQIIVGGVGDGLETNHRPTFFHGVALIVAKLFNQVRPDLAIFGEKDFQQLAVIRRMVRDLNMPVEIIGAPIMRDEQGLALSSRNQYFDADGLKTARTLNQIMFTAQGKLEAGADIALTLQEAEHALLQAGFSSVDYVSLADASTLTLQTNGRVTSPMRLLIAAHCHGVRLIDNCAVDPQSKPEATS